MFDLTGRVALVTGAGQGVGAGIARALAERGAAVGINDLFLDRAEAVVRDIARTGGTARVATGDVTDREAIGATISRLEAALGPVDILVNNAGIPPARFPLKPFREMDPATWEPVISLNLDGVLNCTHALIGGMCDRGWGRIIIVSSEAGRVGVAGGVTVYGAAKGGALAFGRNLATEVGRHGVTVNSIVLALMESNWTSEVSRDASLPIPRLGRPADAAAAAVYLASDEASWVTGQGLPVNGGFLCG